MNAATAHRTLDTAINIRAEVTPETLAAVVKRMNALPKGSTEWVNLRRSLSSYAAGANSRRRGVLLGVESAPAAPSRTPRKGAAPVSDAKWAETQQKARALLAQLGKN